VSAPLPNFEPCVSLDLEMTGVDPESDEIIEIGAVRFDATGILDRFETLVDPGRPLPFRIAALTGINDVELQSAPPFEVVQEQLRDFLGNSPIVGQHVSFDLLYLDRMGLRPPGPVYNTAEIAELLLPGAAEYSLRSLARRLDVPFPVQHRALPDAIAAMGVFLKLRERALELPPALLQQIVALTQMSSWQLRSYFRAIAAAMPGALTDEVPSSSARLTERALTPNAQREPVEPEEVRAVFARLAKTREAFPGFEERPQQAEMASAVATALSSDEHLLVEAGTGTGKSLAYLLPSAIFALRNNERVVVSTSTINLQGQILGKDVPALRRLLASTGPADIAGQADDLRAVALKGRGNYLCLQKFAAFRAQPDLSSEESRFAVKLLLWLHASATGDRAELNLRREEEPLWTRLSAATSNCFASPNSFVRNGSCQLLRARKRAEAAHLVVVNHALLLSDIAAGGRAMPAYDRLIVDEAHNLEEEATDQFGFSVTQAELRNAVNAIYERGAVLEGGWAGSVRLSLPPRAAGDPRAGFVHDLLDVVARLADGARERLPELFARLQAFVANHGEGGGDYDNRLLLTAAKRAQPAWSDVEVAWENVRTALALLQEALGRLGIALSELALSQQAIEGHGNQALAHAQTLAALQRGLDAVILSHDETRVAWLTAGRSTNFVTVASAPLNVGDALDGALFGRKASVVLTSATLSAAGSFAYVRSRLGLDGVEELTLGSPFDYKNAALVLMPSDMPEPNRLDYQGALEASVINLVRASGGRALVLFTSHAALRQTHRAVSAALAGDGIQVLGQGIDGTPADLLAALRSDNRTVLLGTSSFWEGVDVQGEALSLLVIAKLPFSVPSDPVFAARSEQFEDSFREYALPQAILRFKQGFGRLIRHQSDRGVLVVLDRRLRSKSYGKQFIKALPDCTLNDAPQSQLGALVRSWLRAGGGR
jgi:Rad3-related DNA helicase/DNA polymerase III epsilon subunit-like protein